MPTPAEELVLFLASPGDVADERSVCRRVADRVNITCGINIGVRIRVAGWEDVPPAYGRPQALINPWVDQCDIFLGVLHKRWGTETGAADSGFDEEFTRAVDRARSGSSAGPEIALFFKRINAADEADPGPQLLKLLEFRRRIREERIALFREFDDPGDLERQLYEYLVNLVTARERRTSSESGPQAPPTGKDTEHAGPSASESESHIPDASQHQILAVLDGYAAVLRSSDVSSSLDSDRLLLFALAMGRGGMIETHLAHRLHRRRRELRLVQGESLEWNRALVADLAGDDLTESVLPGWYFVGKDALANSVDSLLQDGEPRVEQGAIVLLTRLHLRARSLWPEPDASDEEVQVAAERWAALHRASPYSGRVLRYLGQLAVSSDASLIRAAAGRLGGDEQSQLNALAAGLEGDAENLASASKAIGSALANRVVELLSPALQTLSNAALRAIVEARGAEIIRNLWVRAFALLQDRGDVQDEAVIAGLSSDDQNLQDATLHHVRSRPDATESANKFLAIVRKKDPRSRVIARLLAISSEPDQLRSAAEGTLNDDEWAALMWADLDHAADLARELLRQGVEEWSRRAIELDPTLAEHASLVRYLFGNRAAAAVEKLADLPIEERSVEDLELIRAEAERADRSSLVPAALALGRLGDPSDAGAILLAARSEYGRVKDRLVEAALALGGIEAARTAIRDEDVAISLAGATLLADHPEASGDELRSLLDHADASVRYQATRGLVSSLGRDELERLLSEYAEREVYYYNVVTTLDRCLYGPETLCEATPRP